VAVGMLSMDMMIIMMVEIMFSIVGHETTCGGGGGYHLPK
jgi:hypothetical protein